MRMRRPLPFFLLLSIIAVTAACFSNCALAVGTASDDSRPNLVFILTDDLAHEDIVHMPHLQRLLVDEGTSFTRYYASLASCCPARATLLRGQYAHNTGVKHNRGVDGGYAAVLANGIESDTVATWLNDAGYRTGYIGKYLNDYPAPLPATHVPPGWDEWHSAVAGTPYSQYNYTLNENGHLVDYGSAPEDFGENVYISKAEGFIADSVAAGQPFFLHLSLYAPHQPPTAAPGDEDLFPDAQVPRTPNYNEADVSDKPSWLQQLPLLDPSKHQELDILYRERLRSLQAVDRGIERLVSTLDDSGVANNTYVIFTSDNGFHLGQHRLFPASKLTAYETDIHLPYIVRGPGVPTGETRTALLGDTDVAPTLADLAGVATPPWVDGRSFAGLLAPSTSTPWPRRSYLLNHWRFRSLNDPLEHLDHVALALDMAPDFHGIRTDRYTYVFYHGTNERELYDNVADPEQLTNIASSRPDLAAALQLVLTNLLNCQGHSCTDAENAPLFAVSGDLVDADGDGSDDAADNCPFAHNPDQANLSRESVIIPGVFVYDATNPGGDNTGDACDSDADGDWLTNEGEPSTGTDPLERDTDGDTFLDGAELLCGSDSLGHESTPFEPSVGSANILDTDGDSLPDHCEAAFGALIGLADTDGDGVPDGIEALRKGTSPALSDSDGDGCGDNVELASVDGNTAVTAADLGIVAHPAVFGRRDGEIDFSSRLDMDGNGVITAADLGMVAQNLGQRCA